MILRHTCPRVNRVRAGSLSYQNTLELLHEIAVGCTTLLEGAIMFICIPPLFPVSRLMDLTSMMRPRERSNNSWFHAIALVYWTQGGKQPSGTLRRIQKLKKHFIDKTLNEKNRIQKENEDIVKEKKNRWVVFQKVADYTSLSLFFSGEYVAKSSWLILEQKRNQNRNWITISSNYLVKFSINRVSLGLENDNLNKDDELVIWCVLHRTWCSNQMFLKTQSTVSMGELEPFSEN